MSVVYFNNVAESHSIRAYRYDCRCK